ncbi:MAG: hypothetical protein ABI904_10435 [Chloroflexota bacterium]
MPQNKTVIVDKVQKDNNNKKKFKIKKHLAAEIDTDIEIVDDGDYVVEKLSIDNVGLPTTMADGTSIRWLNNFAIKKKTGEYINQRFKVKIAGLSALKSAGKKIVVYDGNSNNDRPYEFGGAVVDDTFELTDGDPAVGTAPP